MRKRREDIAETRKRIVEAAVDLHGSVGPAHTTFSAVAERAGVQRSTLYRHFADEETLFGACTSHWVAEHPWPRVDDWRRVDDPGERLHLALDQLYVYFEKNEQMLFNSFRDIAVMPAFVGEMIGAQLAAYHEALLEPWEPDVDREKLRPAIALAMDFRAWQALRDGGLEPAAAAELMTTMVCSLAE